MWDLIVSVPDHCLSFYFTNLYIYIYKKHVFDICFKVNKIHLKPDVSFLSQYMRALQSSKTC